MSSASVRRGTVALYLALLVAMSAAGPAASEEPASAKAPQRHADAERLGYALLNCTRSGGWVRADGTCEGYGSGTFSAALPDLRLHRSISRRVAFRWASEMVRAKVCDHVIPGQPVLGLRFSSAGFGYQYLGENVGCGWGAMSAEDLVIAAHLAMQAEQGNGGWHWRNMKNQRYKGVGIGVATLGRMTTVVYDFYGR